MRHLRHNAHGVSFGTMVTPRPRLGIARLWNPKRMRTRGETSGQFRSKTRSTVPPFAPLGRAVHATGVTYAFWSASPAALPVRGSSVARASGRSQTRCSKTRPLARASRVAPAARRFASGRLASLGRRPSASGHSRPAAPLLRGPSGLGRLALRASLLRSSPRGSPGGAFGPSPCGPAGRGRCWRGGRGPLRGPCRPGSGRARCGVPGRVCPRGRGAGGHPPSVPPRTSPPFPRKGPPKFSGRLRRPTQGNK